MTKSDLLLNRSILSVFLMVSQFECGSGDKSVGAIENVSVKKLCALLQAKCCHF